MNESILFQDFHCKTWDPSFQTFVIFAVILPNIAIVIPVPIKIVPIVTALQACHKHEVVTRPSIRKLWKVGRVHIGLITGHASTSRAPCCIWFPFGPVSIFDK